MKGWTVGDLTERLTNLTAKVAAFPADDHAPRPLVDPLSDLERWASKHAEPERNRSCLDRIESHAEWNEANYHSMMGWVQIWGSGTNMVATGRYERALQRVDESPLAVGTKRGRMWVQESWGGPADGYYATVENHRVTAITYYFQDWWDGAELEIDEAEFPWTWKYVSYFVESWTPDNEEDD